MATETKPATPFRRQVLRNGKPVTTPAIEGDYIQNEYGDDKTGRWTENSALMTRKDANEYRRGAFDRHDSQAAALAQIQNIGETGNRNQSPGAKTIRGQVIARNAEARNIRHAASAERASENRSAYDAARAAGAMVPEPTPSASPEDQSKYYKSTMDAMQRKNSEPAKASDNREERMSAARSKISAINKPQEKKPFVQNDAFRAKAADSIARDMASKGYKGSISTKIVGDGTTSNAVGKMNGVSDGSEAQVTNWATTTSPKNKNVSGPSVPMVSRTTSDRESGAKYLAPVADRMAANLGSKSLIAQKPASSATPSIAASNPPKSTTDAFATESPKTGEIPVPPVGSPPDISNVESPEKQIKGYSSKEPSTSWNNMAAAKNEAERQADKKIAESPEGITAAAESQRKAQLFQNAVTLPTRMIWGAVGDAASRSFNAGKSIATGAASATRFLTDPEKTKKMVEGAFGEMKRPQLASNDQ